MAKASWCGLRDRLPDSPRDGADKGFAHLVAHADVLLVSHERALSRRFSITQPWR